MGGQPEVVVGSSRGGAVAMNINSGNAKLVLLCPAWKNWGTAKTVRPDTVILHSRADDVIPFADSEELVRNIDPPLMPGLFGPRWLQRLLYRTGEKFFIDPVVCPFLNEWRHELGLPPVKKITRWWNSRFGVLCMFPDWYSPPQRDWPSPLMQTDFPLWNHSSSEPLADKVEEFLQGGEPPIVFTPGSTNLHGRTFFEAGVAACTILKRRAILLTEYSDQLPSRLPDSVAHFSYVPLDLLLRRSAAFVHHGGIGSTSQAMLAGIPQVLMPLAHDQFDNANRVKRLSLGDSIPATIFSGPRLAMALKSLFDSSTVETACRQTSERLAKRDGLQRSAEAVEYLISRQEVRVAENKRS